MLKVLDPADPSSKWLPLFWTDFRARLVSLLGYSLSGRPPPPPPPAPRRDLPPLLLELGERRPEPLNYLGVSSGLPGGLLRFWTRSGFVPTYIRQTKNDLTGEHTIIMLKVLDLADPSSKWLPLFWTDFRARLVSLLGYSLSALQPALALSLLHNKVAEVPATTLSSTLLAAHLTPYDVKRLELYSNNMADHHLVTDLLPALARLVLTRQLGDLHLSAVQLAILAGLGLQHKTVDRLSEEMELPASQLLALFNRSVRKVSGSLRRILEGGVEAGLGAVAGGQAGAALPCLDTELTEAATQLADQQKKEAKSIVVNKNMSEYVIKGTDSDWGAALSGSKAEVVSVKTGEKRPLEDVAVTESNPTKENKEPRKKNKKSKKVKS
jgi:N-acetyltransferase 10